MEKQQLTQGSVWKRLLQFAFPIMAANLLQAMYGTVDLLTVGLFSDAAQVSAVSTGSMTMQTIHGIVTGLTMGCTVHLGHCIGMRNDRGATRTVASALVLFLIVGAILTAGITAGAGFLTKIMNAPADATKGTTDYIRICGMGVICIILFNAISGMFRGIGDSATPFCLMAVACGVNIVGDLVLVGAFSLGSAGAAIATVFAQGISVAAAGLMIRKHGIGFQLFREELHPCREEIRYILRYGIPVAAQEALTGVSFMIILAILNTFGLTASAGVGVAEKLCGLMFIVPGAMMSAISAFAAQNVGAGRPDRARQSMYASMTVSFAIGCVMFVLSFFWGSQLSGLFTPDREVCLASADYLRSYAVDCLIIGFNFSMMGYLNGYGKTGFVAVQGILSTFLVRIPVSYLMSRMEGTSLFRVGFATPLATVFAIVVTVIYIRRNIPGENKT